MTTTTSATADPTPERTVATAGPAGIDSRGGAVGRGRQLGRVVAAEWVKARSVPSTWTALGSATFIMIAIGAVISGVVPTTDGGPTGVASEPLLRVMAGVAMTQVALGVLGALLITSEYSSRSITSTLAAVPQRGVLLTGKAVLLVALTAPFALLACTLAAAVSLPLLPDDGVQLALTDPVVLRAVLGTALVLVLTGLLGLAVGALLRSTTAAVVVLTAVLFLLPVLIGLLPESINTTVGPWLPSQAGNAVLLIKQQAGYLTPAAGLALAAGYTALVLAAAALTLRRKDA